VASFELIAEIREAAGARVYAEGWQSWSPVGIYDAHADVPRPSDRRAQTVGWRADKPLPPVGLQGEGLLAVELPSGEVRLWHAPDPGSEVPSLRTTLVGDALLVSADGAVSELEASDSLHRALQHAGDRLGPGAVAQIGPGWCSWYYHFSGVTGADIASAVDAAERLELPVETFQIDDGYEEGIGDWLEPSSRFGSVTDTVATIRAAGGRAGIWTAPFLVGDRSRLAHEHPEWLVGDVDAGENWNQRLRILDVTHPGAAEHLEAVFAAFAALGIDYHKLDFLYAGALPGRRREDCTPLAAYREGLRIIRRAAGDAATLLGCGAPLLPSIGLVDAMRVGPDVLPEPGRGDDDLRAAIRKALQVTRARAWMNGRLWVSDPDCLVARPEVPERETWAAHVATYGGLVVSSDRLDELDERGVELTRRAMNRPLNREEVAS
jgi:alpha-galactosidase